jgi:hypothetical protein
MNRRRFFQFLATGILAAQMHFPLGGIPKIISEPAPVGGVLTRAMLRRAVEMMKQARVPQGPVIYWVHPRDEERFKKMFGYG